MILRALLLLVPFLALSCAAAQDRASAAMRTWDDLVTRERFADVAALDRTVRQDGTERV